MPYLIISTIGFIVLGLSPSFVDWQQSPDLRTQIAAYYIVAVILIVFGLDGWRKA